MPGLVRVKDPDAGLEGPVLPGATPVRSGAPIRPGTVIDTVPADGCPGRVESSSLWTVNASFSPSVATSSGPPRTGAAASEVVNPQNGMVFLSAPVPAVTVPLPLANRSQVRVVPLREQVESGPAIGFVTVIFTVALVVVLVAGLPTHKVAV